MIIWITGISGVGKTTLAKFCLNFLKKKRISFVHIDGDHFRKMFENDLGYSLKDRDKNARRLIKFAEFLNQNKINLIISANLTSLKYRLIIRKKFKKKLFQIHIETNTKNILNRDKRGIYKKTNVVGKNIKLIKNNTYDMLISNNQKMSDLKKEIKKIFKALKKN